MPRSCWPAIFLGGVFLGAVFGNWNDTSTGIDLDKVRHFPLTKIRSGWLKDGSRVMFDAISATAAKGDEREVQLRGLGSSGKPISSASTKEIAEIEERIARYVRMLAQEAGEGGIGGKVGLVGEKGRVVRQHDLEVGRIPAEQADELGFGSVGVRLFGHGRGRLRQSGGG